MKRIAYASALAAVLFLSFAACEGDNTETGGSGGQTTSSSSGTGGATSSGTGGATSSGSGGAGGEASSTIFHCDAEPYAQDAIDNGTVVFNGVSLPASTPIDQILADTASYVDEVVRIEGFVVEVCTSAGCYVSLEGASGGFINLKVDDGAFDFRDSTEMGSYAIGEGVFSAIGEHGAQVYIQDHGALISAQVCTE